MGLGYAKDGVDLQVAAYCTPFSNNLARQSVTLHASKQRLYALMQANAGVNADVRQAVCMSCTRSAALT